MNAHVYDIPAPTCEVCGQTIKGQSYDLMCSITVYDRTTHEPIKSMIEPDKNVISDDYIVVGMDCCGDRVRNVWNRLQEELIREEVT